MPDPVTDALSSQRPSSSLIPAPNYDLIEVGDEQAMRQELANALRNIVNAVNTYISRKGV